MKKILIIAYDYPPINNGGVQRILAFKKYLPSYGYQIGIITTDSFGSIEDESGVYRFPDKGHDISHNGFVFIAYPYKVVREVLVRMGLVSDWFYLWKKEVIKNIKKIPDINSYDYIMASYPSVSNLELGEIISDKFGIPLIVDYRDGLMYKPFDLITKRPIWYRKRLKKLEKRLAQKAIIQFVVNEDMLCYYNCLNDKTFLVSNAFDDEELFDDDSIDLPGGFNVVYTGALSLSRSAYSIDCICEFLRQFKDVNFVFIGKYTPNEKKELKKVENVYINSPITRKKIIPTQRKADILLFLSGDDKSWTSGKLYEYLFSDKPILNIGGESIASRIIKETNSGSTIQIDDINLISRFIDDVRTGHQFIRNDQINKYTRRYQCRVFAEILDVEGKKI